MRILAYAAAGVMVCSSSCTSLDYEGKRSDQKSSPVGRLQAFTKQITTTVSEVSADVLPIVGAVGKEVFREAKSDVPKVAQELGSQATHLSSLRKPRQSNP